jgi:alpha 1,2-mannosyltransferase
MLISSTSSTLRLLPIPIIIIIYYTFILFRGREYTLRNSQPPSFSINATVATSSLNLTDTKSNFSPAVNDFWLDLAISLEAARPQCSPLQVEDGHPTLSETTFEPLKPDKKSPERLVNFTDADETALLRAHYLMRISAQQLAPRLVFSSGEQGIVTTVNAKYMPIFLVSLRMLRRTGCQLPLEVFIDDWATYDPTIC